MRYCWKSGRAGPVHASGAALPRRAGQGCQDDRVSVSPSGAPSHHPAPFGISFGACTSRAASALRVRRRFGAQAGSWRRRDGIDHQFIDAQTLGQRQKATGARFGVIDDPCAPEHREQSFITGGEIGHGCLFDQHLALHRLTGAKGAHEIELGAGQALCLFARIADHRDDREQHFWRGTLQHRHVVMFRKPQAFIAQLVERAGQRDRCMDSLAGTHPLGQGGLFENGKLHGMLLDEVSVAHSGVLQRPCLLEEEGPRPEMLDQTGPGPYRLGRMVTDPAPHRMPLGVCGKLPGWRSGRIEPDRRGQVRSGRPSVLPIPRFPGTGFTLPHATDMRTVRSPIRRSPVKSCPAPPEG
jgi:hypothetical protein